ncbi:MAG: hypothetical protein ACHQUC_05450 [Chlamydiales bacterium]
MNGKLFLSRVVRGCIMSLLCALPLSGTAETIAEHHFNTEYSVMEMAVVGGDEIETGHECSRHPKHTLHFSGSVAITNNSPPITYDIFITPFVTSPNGKTITGETIQVTRSSSVSVAFGGLIVPAIHGNYVTGVKISSPSDSDIQRLSFGLSNEVISSRDNTITALGGTTYTLSRLLGGVMQTQFVNNFVYTSKGKL